VVKDVSGFLLPVAVGGLVIGLSIVFAINNVANAVLQLTPQPAGAYAPSAYDEQDLYEVY